MFCRVTARRTKEGLVTEKREMLGPAPDDPEAFLDRVAEILARDFIGGFRGRRGAASGRAEELTVSDQPGA